MEFGGKPILCSSWVCCCTFREVCWEHVFVVQGWLSLDSFVCFGEPHATLWVPAWKDNKSLACFAVTECSVVSIPLLHWQLLQPAEGHDLYQRPLTRGGSEGGSKTWLGLMWGFRLVGRLLHPKLPWTVFYQGFHKLVWWGSFSILTGSRLIASALDLCV